VDEDIMMIDYKKGVILLASGWYQVVRDGLPVAFDPAVHPKEVAEIKAYLAEHPEALIPEPQPPEPTPEEIAAAEEARIEAEETEKDRAFYRAFRKANEDGELAPLEIAMQAVTKLKAIKEL
jgi:hypothetical protein